MGAYNKNPGANKRQNYPRIVKEPERTLLPAAALIPLWFVALTLPNLIYAGRYWYETLHLTKWVVCGASVAIAGLIAGWRMFWYGNRNLTFKTDGFFVLWLMLFVYVLVQPLWTRIWSISSFVQESFCFAAVVGFYIMTLNSFPLPSVRPLIWLANISGAVNVVFAEIQTRPDIWLGYYNLMGETLPLILPTPGNYIGNTGQQNMFGLWLAICVMNSAYLFSAYSKLPSGEKRPLRTTLLNIFFLLVNFWGLVNSTSRSGMLSLAVGFFVLLVMFFFLKADKGFIKRMLAIMCVFAVIIAGVVLFSAGRASSIVSKTVDMVQNAETVGGRIDIWRTSAAMFGMYPVRGVGLGQYKWHYLEAQRKLIEGDPDTKWQYTHWAHNEFLQWFCEAGTAGGLIMVFMLGWWFVSVMACLIRKKETSSEAIWANALLGLLLFNALWTRPFHRIENILWLSLAFAIANREMLLRIPKLHMLETVGRTGKYFSKKWVAPVFAVLFMVTAAGGLYFLADGMYGDRQIRLALSSSNPDEQKARLAEAHKSVMVRLEAEKRLAYHYISYGEAISSDADIRHGLTLLLGYFEKEPHSEEIQTMLQWASKLRNKNILDVVATYFKPGTFNTP